MRNSVHVCLARFRTLLIRASVSGLLILLAASAAHAQHTVTATWDRNSDAYTVGYRLFYGTTSGSYQWSVDVGNVVSAPLNLSPGNYFFAVRAYNASYQYGPTSSEVSFTVGSTPAPTAAIQATLQGGNTALVTWQTTNAASATLNGSSVPVNGSTTIAVSATTTFTIVARSAGGVTATASATVTLGTPPPTAAIQAVLESPNTARVTWQTTNASAVRLNGSAVAANGSIAVPVTQTTTFTLLVYSSSGATATASATVTLGTPPPTATIQATLEGSNTARVTWQTTNAVSATLNGATIPINGTQTFTVNQTTTYTIVARNSAGTTATASATVTVANGQPTAAIQAAMEGPNTARLTWQTTNAATARINGNTVALNGSMTVTVTTNTSYNLVARSSSGVQARATVVVSPQSGSGPPLPPVNLQSSVAGTRVTLTWQRNPSGGAPTEYLLYIGTTASGSNVANGIGLGNVQSVSTNLPNGTYYARIRARNGQGTSASSPTVSFRIGTQLAAPSGLTANWNGTQTTLTWVAPAADAPELMPTDYVLEAGTAPGLADVAVMRVGKATSFTADVPYGVYYVRVRAINDRGDSDPTEDLVVAAPGTAAAPEELTSDGDGMTVNLRWSPPAAGAERPMGYLIEAGSEPGLSDLATIQVGSVSGFTTEAPPGTYFVRVRAITSRGPGVPSNEVIVQK